MAFQGKRTGGVASFTKGTGTHGAVGAAKGKGENIRLFNVFPTVINDALVEGQMDASLSLDALLEIQGNLNNIITAVQGGGKAYAKTYANVSEKTGNPYTTICVKLLG